MNEARSQLPFGLSWEKVIIWGLFGGLVYNLRYFFTIVFMTFIMSYMAQNLSSFLLQSVAGKSEDHWWRKLILMAIYMTAVVLGYLAGQSIVPRAIDQGRLLLDQVQRFNLEKMRDEIMGRTLGRIEFTRYRHSDRFAEDFGKFKREKYNLLDFQESKQIAGEIKQTFETEIVLQEGRAALDALKLSPEWADQYRKWLRSQRVEQEITSNPDLAQKWSSEFRDGWITVNGPEAYQAQKDSAAYLDSLKNRLQQRFAEKLFAEGKYREDLEKELVQKLGSERVKVMKPPELERRFKEFFVAQAPLRWRTFPYDYEKLRILDAIQDEKEFQETLNKDMRGLRPPEELFEEWMSLKLAKEHPLSQMVGDTSHLVRSVLPKITTWLTDALNSLLSFGLNALLAMAFSFMFVWEVPALRRGLKSVHGTRAERLYNEFAPAIYRLGIVIGTAFSAQLLIAFFNAILTFIALSLLKFPSAIFLSLAVMVCSLMPYIGVPIAGVPVLIVGLQTGGIPLAFNAALALFVIHEIEAWFLSPMILGEFLQLNPIVVILVLFIGQQVFGLWGLFLAAPVSVFILNEVLLKPVDPPARPPETPAPG